jgi:hypothetical protein
MLRKALPLVSVVVLLAACSGEGSSETSAPGGSSTASPSVTDPRVLTEKDDTLAAGTYLMDALEAPDATELPYVEITVPDGWGAVGSWGVHNGAPDDRWIAVTLWQVEGVYAHPCKWSLESLISPGPTAAGLADVLTTIPLRDATKPVDLEMNGYTGTELEWSVPADAHFSRCVDDTFQSWREWDGGDRFQQGPGQVDRLLMLDVDGQRLVIDVSVMPGATDHDRAMMDRVVDSIRIGPSVG